MPCSLGNCSWQHERATLRLDCQNIRKEENPMETRYEAPELTVIGEAEEVVLGTLFNGDDYPWKSAADFEFAQD